MPPLKFGEREAVYIVAEIGQNHQGCFEMAKRMIREAKHTGVDAVKFQKSNLKEKFTESVLERPYLSSNSFGATYGEHKTHLEFCCAEMEQLKDYSEEMGLDFGVSPMDPVSMEEMVQLRPTFIKIGSGDTNNFPMLRTAASSGIPVIISTGMQRRSTIQQAIDTVSECTQNFAVLHCISSYPTEANDVNMSQMIRLMEDTPVVGYSGHEQGFSPSMLAVMLGARIIERHFTLDNEMKGSDHKCSLNPCDMKTFVSLVRSWESLPKSVYKPISRNIAHLDFFPHICGEDFQNFTGMATGSPRTEDIYPCEAPCRDKLGKAVVYRKSLEPGAILSAFDISIKVSDERGCLPGELYDGVLGKEIQCAVEKDQAVQLDHFARSTTEF